MAALPLLRLIICICTFRAATATVLVQSEDTAFYRARLFGAKKDVSEGDTVDLKCSTTGFPRHWDRLYVYLCKNGAGIQMKVLEKGEEDTAFIMKDVRIKDSGNYSCAYTKDKHQLSEIINSVISQENSTGDDVVIIQVYRYRVKVSYPARLFGANTYVGEGDTVDLKCSTTGFPRHWDRLHVYLCKNGAGIEIKVLEKGEEDTAFIMKDLRIQDSGNYSCAYTKDKLQLSKINSQGDNLVVIQVLDKHQFGQVNSTGDNLVVIQVLGDGEEELNQEAAHILLVNVIRLICSAVVVLLLLTVTAISYFC